MSPGFREPPERGPRLGGSDCERLRGGALAQPVNTLTSFAFVVAGGAACRRGASCAGELRPELVRYSALLAAVGVGSAAYHGTQPPGSKHMHDLPIAAIVTLALSTPLVRRRRGWPPAPGWTRGRVLRLGALAVAAGLAYAGGRTSAPTCDPDSPVQLHGAWHVLSAAALLTVADILYAPVTRD